MWFPAHISLQGLEREGVTMGGGTPGGRKEGDRTLGSSAQHPELPVGPPKQGRGFSCLTWHVGHRPHPGQSPRLR